VVDELRSQEVIISESAVKMGIEQTVTLTGLKGRWQKLGDHPMIYCDTAHNAEGISEVLQIINELTFQRLHFVFGMVKDKDSSAVLSLLPKDAVYYFCEAKIPRALDVNTLTARAKEFNLMGQAFKGVDDAIKAAKQEATKDDLIFIGGSTFVVAEIEAL
jgi:dihydrofolate synthase/folylpolyglutamate synthase